MTDSRRKGRRFENEVVGYLRAHGYQAERISEAGLAGPDIQAFGGRMIEAKIRSRDAFPSLIRKGLRDASIFIFREDHGPMVVAMDLDELLDMLEEAATMWPKLNLNGGTPAGGENPPLSLTGWICRSCDNGQHYRCEQEVRGLYCVCQVAECGQ